jgi:hypothetical protein
MTDETRERVRKIIANAIIGDSLGWTTEDWLPEADAVIDALDLAGIRFAGEGEVVVDAGSLDDLKRAVALTLEGDGYEADNLAFLQSAYLLIGGGDGN